MRRTLLPIAVLLSVATTARAQSFDNSKTEGAMTRFGLLLVGLAVAALPLAAQSNAPRFEIASIRQRISGFGSSRFSWEGQTLTTVNVSLVGLVQYAYGVTEVQIVGGPDWVRTDGFDIVARMEADATQDQIALMLRALLEERFTLRLRNEKREMAIFELGLANNDGRVGPNLHDCSKLDDEEANRNRSFTGPPGGNVAAGGCGPMSRVVGLAAGHVQGIVHDKTGLSGNWRYNVFFGPDLPDPNSANPDLPSFVTALREQLGLRLDRTRGPVDVLVIDSVERPTPN